MDYTIIQNCIGQKPRGWKNLIDRYLGLVLQVIDYLCETQNRHLTEEQRELLCETVFQEFQRNEYQILRKYHGPGSVSSYLTIVARQIVLNRLKTF